MNYIVFDLEWNQSTNYAEARPSLPFEIIEIGAVKLDAQRNEIGRFDRFVRPKIYRRMNPMTKKVTHLDVKNMKNEALFPEVMKDFLEFCGDDFIFCTWGESDLWELQRNMRYFHVDNPFPQPLLFYDVQKLYSLLYDDGRSRLGLQAAIEERGMAEEEAFHLAISDALYTARLLQGMNLALDGLEKYVSVDYFRLPETPEEEIYLVFPTYAKYVSRPFKEKDDMLRDKYVTQTRCYLCGRAVKKLIRWFPTGQKTYQSLLQCPQHGYLKGKIRIKKARTDDVFAVRTVKCITEEQAEQLRARREDFLEKRRETVKKKRVRAKEKKRAARLAAEGKAPEATAAQSEE